MVFCALGALTVTTAARAGTATPPVEASAAPDADWRLGASVGFGGLSGLDGAGGLGALGGLGVAGAGSAPSLTAGLERRLGDALWLMLDVRGAVASGSASSSHALGAGVGVRWVLNAGDPVEVGLAVTASGGFSGTDVDGTSQSARARHAELGLGLVTDVALGRGVGLRVAASLASLGWQSSELTDDAGATTSDDGVRAGLTLAPSLGLGVVF
ncbi:MAG: hypothetical protein U1F43_05340 [Myxococcota bacterium]